MLICSFFPFFSSLLTLSVNELVLRQLTATLPALVRLGIVLSQLKHRNTGKKNWLQGHSKTHCLFVLLSHIPGMGHGAGVSTGLLPIGVPQMETIPFSVVPQLQGCSTAPSLLQQPSCVYCHAAFSLEGKAGSLGRLWVMVVRGLSRHIPALCCSSVPWSIS